MPLAIETFSNISGGYSFFKAVGHPFSARRIEALLGEMEGPVAFYDPLGFAKPFAEIYSCSGIEFAGVYVQDIEKIGEYILRDKAQPVIDLPYSGAKTVFIVAFDAERLVDNIGHLVPEGVKIVTLDEVRLDDDMISASRYYLEPINFATYFAFFRDAGGHHTRIVTVNYWAGYGAKDVWFWCCLFYSQNYK